MVRLFTALELPDDVKAQLGRVRGGIDGARWIDPEQYHLTLRFIGEVGHAEANETADALGSIRFAPFDLRFEGYGIFGKIEKPRALWAGVEDPLPIRHLHEKVDRCLDDAGFKPEERKFTPHVTLARFKQAKSSDVMTFLEAHASPGIEPIRVAHFALFVSHLGHTGAQYEVVERYAADGVLLTLPDA